MKQGNRAIRYDEQLQVEAYSFEGVAQSFPQHFHAYYVWGYAAQGERLLTCCGKRLTLAAGEIPALTLKLKPGEDVLEAARDLVEDLKLAAEEAAGGTP